MAFNETYANFDLVTGDDDGTSEANAYQTVTSMNTGHVAGDRVNIKRQATAMLDSGAGVGTLVFTNGGTIGNPSSVRGYETVPGDGGIWELEADWNQFAFTTGQAFNITENIKFTGIGVHTYNFYLSDTTTSDGIFCRRCIGYNANVRLPNAINCYFEVERTQAISLTGINGAPSMHIGNVFKRTGSETGNTKLVDNDSYAKSQAIIGNIFIGNGLSAGETGMVVRRNSNARFAGISDNIFYNLESGVRVETNPTTPGSYLLQFANNIFSEMSGYAIDRNDASPAEANVFIHDNAYHDCTSGFTNYDSEQTVIEGSNTAIAVSPFVDPATDDFSLTNISDGGGAIRAAFDQFMIPDDPASMKTHPAYRWVEPVIAGGGGTTTVWS